MLGRYVEAHAKREGYRGGGGGKGTLHVMWQQLKLYDGWALWEGGGVLSCSQFYVQWEEGGSGGDPE